MDVAGLPLWGQLSILGLSFGLNALGWLATINGFLITKREQDRRDAKHAAEIVAKDQEIRDWKELWQSSQDSLTKALDGTSKAVGTMEVFEGFIKSIPIPQDDDNE